MDTIIRKWQYNDISYEHDSNLVHSVFALFVKDFKTRELIIALILIKSCYSNDTIVRWPMDWSSSSDTPAREVDRSLTTTHRM